ncbi:unnamed protein product, partial [Prunus brigantina]
IKSNGLVPSLISQHLSKTKDNAHVFLNIYQPQFPRKLKKQKLNYSKLFSFIIILFGFYTKGSIFKTLLEWEVVTMIILITNHFPTLHIPFLLGRNRAAHGKNLRLNLQMILLMDDVN